MEPEQAIAEPDPPAHADAPTPPADSASWTPAASPKARSLQLDILRGAAILLVIGHHNPYETGGGALQSFGRLWDRVGWSGVDLFFVLSGFLVGGLLMRDIAKHGTPNVKRFLVRRGFKIWPAYYVYLVWVLLVGVVVAGGVPDHYAFNWLHLQNYLGTPRTHTWSLAVEEHFYLALPLLILLLTRRGADGMRRLPYICLGVMVVCPILRALTCMNSSDLEEGLYYRFPTHLRLDGLAFGVWLGYLHHFRPERLAALTRRKWLLTVWAGLCLLPLCIWPVQSRFMTTIGASLTYLGYGAVLLLCLGAQQGRGLRGRLLWSRAGVAVAWVGYYSYSIYLWHAEGNSMLIRLVPEVNGAAPWALMTLVVVALGVVPGIVMSRLIEVPSLRLRDRLFPSL
jgi:peptidoglycan/LPS O-acetylase OafA/YrhL